jgi:predicted GTPase
MSPVDELESTVQLIDGPGLNVHGFGENVKLALSAVTVVVFGGSGVSWTFTVRSDVVIVMGTSLTR